MAQIRGPALLQKRPLCFIQIEPQSLIQI
jgi:hypothetical protein